MNCKTRKYLRKPHMDQVTKVKNLVPLGDFEFLPYAAHQYDSSNYQLFTKTSNVLSRLDGSVIIFSEKIPVDKQEEIYYDVPEWARKSRESKQGGIVYYSHTSGKLFSKDLISPPFRMDAITDMPCVYGHVPSLWLRNDLQGKTRELDVFESYPGKVTFTGHIGGHNYEDRKIHSTKLYIEPKELQSISIEITKTRADWFFNGQHIKKLINDFDCPFHVIASLGVVSPDAESASFNIKSLKILY